MENHKEEFFDKLLAKHTFRQLASAQREQLKSVCFKQIMFFESRVLEHESIDSAPMQLRALIRTITLESTRKHFEVTSKLLGDMDKEIESITYNMLSMILENWIDVYDHNKSMVENYIENWENKEI
jgi:hypothetical protein